MLPKGVEVEGVKGPVPGLIRFSQCGQRIAVSRPQPCRHRKLSPSREKGNYFREQRSLGNQAGPRKANGVGEGLVRRHACQRAERAHRDPVLRQCEAHPRGLDEAEPGRVGYLARAVVSPWAFRAFQLGLLAVIGVRGAVGNVQPFPSLHIRAQSAPRPVLRGKSGERGGLGARAG